MKNLVNTNKKIFLLYILASTFVGGLLFINNKIDQIDQDQKQIEYLNNKLDSLKFEVEILEDKVSIKNNLLRKKANKISGLKIPKTFGLTEIETVFYECQKYKIPPRIIFRLINAESTFRPGVYSNKGARGYMQLMPKTYDANLKELNLDEKNPVNNLKVGIYYISKLYNRFKGYPAERMYLTLLSYNLGPTKVSNNIDYYLTSEEFLNYEYIKKIIN